MEQNFSLENLKVTNLPELQNWEERLKKVVEENPFIEVVDNSTYEIGKKRRTTLSKSRTELQNQEKAIASKLASFRKEVGAETQKLIDITQPHEYKQDGEVKSYEAKKQAEKEEKERLERERVARIENRIKEIENICVDVICAMVFENIETTKSSFEKELSTDEDFAEFYLLFDQVKERMVSLFESRKADLVQRENQRLENERLRKEKEESDAKLKAIQDQQENERKEREEKEYTERAEREKKELEEKNQIFEIRKKRLGEIGYSFTHLETFFNDEFRIELSWDCFNCDAVSFESIFDASKNLISEAKQKAEDLQKQKEQEEASRKAEADKLAKENVKRVKRLAKDKEVYKTILKDKLGGFPTFFDSPQIEIADFSADAHNRVMDLLNELLTNLDNL